jgi:hypothetical protein
MGERAGAMLRLLGLARRAGRLHLGSGPVLRALGQEGPGIVFLARDAGADLRRRIERARGSSRLDDTTFVVDDLAAAFGRERLATVSVHDRDFVAGLRRYLDEPPQECDR